MPTSTNPPRPLADLLTELEAAVRTGDRARATQLEQTILQRLASEAADRASLERRVRALMAALDQPAAGPRDISLDPFTLERGSPLPTADGVVYPVWFGTNRKPTALGDGFTGERHDRITHGRVEVYVPEAHRFGETGTGFWRRLLRFDLRDDRLRLQHVERQEREAFFADIHQACRPHATAASSRTRCASCMGSTSPSRTRRSARRRSATT